MGPAMPQKRPKISSPAKALWLAAGVALIVLLAMLSLLVPGL